MNTKSVCRNIVLSVVMFLIATFIVSCNDWTQRDAKTSNEIATVEEQIRQIDQQIAQRIARKMPKSNTVHPTKVYVDNNRSYAEKTLDNLMSERPTPIDSSDIWNNEIDAEIHKLKSEREMLIVKLNALYQSLNK